MAHRPHQDWTEVKLKPKPTPGAKKQEVKTAMQSTPQAVTTIKKTTGGTNKQHAKPDFDARALDKDEGDYEVKTVGVAVGKAIQQGRQAKGLTQKDLAQKIQEKPQVVQLYETGKAVPSQQILSKMEKALGVKLRGIS